MTRLNSDGRCRHENADHLMPGERFNLVDDSVSRPLRYTECEQFRCLDCGAWLSLGEANDADPRVAVEIEAARIAAAFEADGGCELSSLERHGFADEALHLRGGCLIDLTATMPARWGQLARVIVDHGATHGDE